MMDAMAPVRGGVAGLLGSAPNRFPVHEGPTTSPTTIVANRNNSMAAVPRTPDEGMIQGSVRTDPCPLQLCFTNLFCDKRGSCHEGESLVEVGKAEGLADRVPTLSRLLVGNKDSSFQQVLVRSEWLGDVACIVPCTRALFTALGLFRPVEVTSRNS